MGFEESTFNLADLVRHQREVRDEDDESGIGHAEVRNVMSPQPGQSDDTLSDKVRMFTFITTLKYILQLNFSFKKSKFCSRLPVNVRNFLWPVSFMSFLLIFFGETISFFRQKCLIHSEERLPTILRSKV